MISTSPGGIRQQLPAPNSRLPLSRSCSMHRISPSSSSVSSSSSASTSLVRAYCATSYRAPHFAIDFIFELCLRCFFSLDFCATSCLRNHSRGHQSEASNSFAKEAGRSTQNVDDQSEGGSRPPQQAGPLRPPTSEPGLKDDQGRLVARLRCLGSGVRTRLLPWMPAQALPSSTK